MRRMPHHYVAVRAALSCAWLVCLLPTVATAADSLALLPGSFKLTGPAARQTLVVETSRDGRFVGQETKGLAWETSNPKVVVVENGEAISHGNGEATITAVVGDRRVSAKVEVTRFDQPHDWSFRNHVEAVLAKTGCSSGACHGAQAGKNGFKISLLGYDPEGDFQTITRQARGRRIVPSDPGRSLLLTKPTGAIPHKGGLRFSVDSRDYRVLVEWIAAGMPAPKATDRRIERLEIVPSGVVLKPGMNQQFVLLAHFNDGFIEDVTRWGKYTSTNESVAQVNEVGHVNVMGHGEGAITAWYLSKVVIASVSSPYEQKIPSEVFAKAEKRNFIDELVLAKLENLNLPPSPAASDSEFLRRAFIDTIGVLPTADETRKFLADKSPDRRDRLIDALLSRPEWVDYWAYKWSDLLLVNSEKLRFNGPGTGPKSASMWAFYTWIRNHVEANTPWDVMVRELVTAKGSTLENGGANFFMLHKDPLDLAETTTVAFLGMSINCARCHNHPLEKWTNNQYYAMANLYARVRTKSGTEADSDVVFAASEGDLVQPLTGKPQPPTPLDGVPLALDSPEDRRMHLAKWLTAPENPYFSRSITNRVWANFMGVGLVEMVDDMRLTNPASNEQLLSATAKYLVENRYDLKSLMRLILQSKTYQRSAQPLPGNLADRRFYSRYYPRRMMAEVLLDALSAVSGAPTTFGGYPAGWRSMQLPDSMVDSYFLQTFGRADRQITCTCERSSEPTMVQVLNISNGKGLNDKLQAKGNRIDAWMTAKMPADKIVDEVYLTALSRYPTPDEKTRLLAALAETNVSERRLVLEDLCWGILSSKEFLFNH
jgi:hypothetical protein